VLLDSEHAPSLPALAGTDSDLARTSSGPDHAYVTSGPKRPTLEIPSVTRAQAESNDASMLAPTSFAIQWELRVGFEKAAYEFDATGT
jgi:hypothetical protein